MTAFFWFCFLFVLCLLSSSLKPGGLDNLPWWKQYTQTHPVTRYREREIYKERKKKRCSNLRTWLQFFLFFSLVVIVAVVDVVVIVLIWGNYNSFDIKSWWMIVNAWYKCKVIWWEVTSVCMCVFNYVTLHYVTFLLSIIIIISIA